MNEPQTKLDVNNYFENLFSYFVPKFVCHPFQSSRSVWDWAKGMNSTTQKNILSHDKSISVCTSSCIRYIRFRLMNQNWRIKNSFAYMRIALFLWYIDGIALTSVVSHHLSRCRYEIVIVYFVLNWTSFDAGDYYYTHFVSLIKWRMSNEHWATQLLLWI